MGIYILATSGGNDFDTKSKLFDCTGADYLIVLAAGGGGASEKPSAIKYNGVDLTLTVTKDSANGVAYASAWRLRNPTQGSNTLAITSSGIGYANRWIAISLRGVKEYNTSASSTSTTTYISSSIPSALHDYLIFDAVGIQGGAGRMRDAGQTELYNDSRGAMSYKLATGAAVTMGWTLGIATSSAHVMISLAPSGNRGVIIF
jgi:hypothetical protein